MKNNQTKGLIGVFAFAATAMANNITMGILAYIMQTYSQFEPVKVSLLMTFPSVVGTVFAFLAGSIMNKIGAKKLTLFVHFMLFLTGMTYYFLGTKSLYICYFASAISGFLMGSMGTIQGQLLLEIVPDEGKRANYLGYCASAMSAGGVVFATLGGILAARNGGTEWNKAYILFLAIPVSLVLEFICLPSSKKSEGGEKGAAAEGAPAEAAPVGKMPVKVYAIAIHYLFFFLFLYAFGLNCSEYIITTKAIGTSVESGLATSMNTVGGIIAGATFGLVSSKLKKAHMPIMVGLTVVGLAIICFVNAGIVPVYVAAILMGYAMAAANPYVMMELSRIAPGPLYPKAMSIYSGCMNAGMMVAVYALSFLSKTFMGGDTVMGKLKVALIGCAVCTLVAIPIYMGGKKEKA